MKKVNYTVHAIVLIILFHLVHIPIKWSSLYLVTIKLTLGSQNSFPHHMDYSFIVIMARKESLWLEKSYYDYKIVIMVAKDSHYDWKRVIMTGKESL